MGDTSMMSMKSLLEADRQEQLEVEIYKTEQELERQFTVSTPVTTGPSGFTTAETRLKRTYDGLIVDNQQRLMRLEELRVQASRVVEWDSEGSTGLSVEGELGRLRSRQEAEFHQTEQLKLLMQRETQTIQHLKDQINRLEDANRRLKAPCEKSAQAEHLAMNSVALLQNDKVQFQAEAASRRSVYLSLKEKQEKIKTMTTEETKNSIERLSRYKLKHKAKTETTVRLKELLSQGLSELTVTKQLNAQLTSQLEAFYSEIDKIARIIQGMEGTLSGKYGLSPAETETVIACHRQMVSREASLKHQFSILSAQADIKRADCSAIRAELDSLKAASLTKGSASPLPSSANILRHDLKAKLGCDSREVYLQEVEGIVMKVIISVLDLMERGHLVLRTITESCRQSEDTLKFLESFSTAVNSFRRGLRSHNTQTTRHRSLTLDVPSKRRRQTFKTEVDLRHVPASPSTISALKAMVEMISPSLKAELPEMLSILKLSKVFNHFLDHNELLGILRLGVPAKQFPKVCLMSAHSAFKQFLQTVLMTYQEFYAHVVKKTEQLKTTVEARADKLLPALRTEHSLQLGGLRSTPVKPNKSLSSRLHQPTKPSEVKGTQESNSYDERLGKVQRQLKSAANSRHQKKPTKKSRQAAVVVPMTASQSRHAVHSTKLLTEIKRYDSKLAEFSLHRKLSSSQSSAMQLRMSPRPRFMTIADMLERRKTLGRTAVSRPSFG
jgi:hypothetical protein